MPKMNLMLTKCEKLYICKDHLDQHIQSALEEIKFPCNDCGYEATQRADLLKHIRSVHESIKFPCDSCDYKATRKDHLNTHLY